MANPAPTAVTDAVSALVNLGYGQMQAAQAVSSALKKAGRGFRRREADPCSTQRTGDGMNTRPLATADKSPRMRSTHICVRSAFPNFVGQTKAKQNLSVFIEAAKQRKEALDHVLFAGPPGLGKTTLAQIMARELGVNFKATSGPVIAKAGDLAALLTNLEDRDVLFIDEIHRLNPGGRGSPLSRDGGLPARSHHRRRPGGALGAH